MLARPDMPLHRPEPSQMWNDCVSRFGQKECVARYDPQQLVKVGMGAARLWVGGVVE